MSNRIGWSLAGQCVLIECVGECITIGDDSERCEWSGVQSERHRVSAEGHRVRGIERERGISQQHHKTKRSKRPLERATNPNHNRRGDRVRSVESELT